MKTDYDTTGVPSGAGLRFAIIVGEWHREHSQHMIDEANAIFAAHGAPQVDVVWTPGAFEIPVVARALCKTQRYAALLAFGIVLRGETRHFEMIADGVTYGLMDLMLATGVPIMNEIIAAESMSHVLARTQKGPANKGREAAIAALKVAAVLQQTNA